jgi:hypothetical protein
MRLCAAVVLAGCSFQGRAASNPNGDGPVAIDARAPDSPIVVDAPPDAPPDAFVFLDARAHPPNWWNAAWGSRMRLTISNTSTAAMATGYQVGLALDLDAAPCTGSRDQVRIVYNNTTDLPRVIDEVGTTEWTWFPLQAQIDAGTTNTSYWLYCENPSPTAASSDPTMVFDVWDDFAGNSLANTWASQGTVAVANGSVTIGANGGIHSNATYGANTALDVMATATGSSVSNPEWWLGYETNFNITAPWVVWYAHNANTIMPSVNEAGTQHNDTAVALDANAHLYGVETYGATSAFRLADAIVDNHTNTSAIGALNLRLHVLQTGGTVSFDWVRVRKAVSPAPGVAVGTVETY